MTMRFPSNPIHRVLVVLALLVYTSGVSTGGVFFGGKIGLVSCILLEKKPAEGGNRAAPCFMNWGPGRAHETGPGDSRDPVTPGRTTTALWPTVAASANWLACGLHWRGMKHPDREKTRTGNQDRWN